MQLEQAAKRARLFVTKVAFYYNIFKVMNGSDIGYRAYELLTFIKKEVTRAPKKTAYKI
jgi:hypothetical protein